MKSEDLDIFLTTAPGLEATLCSEIAALDFRQPKAIIGGVTIKGSWKDVWRANLMVRGASRVLVRLGTFKANHLAKLDKKARNFPWGDTLLPDVPVRVEVTCKKSRIYHDKAAAQRIATAISEELGAPISPEADICIKARIYDDECTISVDTSGESLHKRGHKEAVNKAPMRENIAALLLRACGYDGQEPVLDPMCGSGTFPIEAAEIAAGLYSGRSRNFAFEHLKTFNAEKWQQLKSNANTVTPELTFYGSDRDTGAITISTANAVRAGVADCTSFEHKSISDITPPDGQAGLIIINPPYGVRIGDTRKLRPLYGSLGKRLSSHFKGWRVGIITNNDGLAMSTTLPFDGAPLSFSHGGIRVKLFQTDILK